MLLTQTTFLLAAIMGQAPPQGDAPAPPAQTQTPAPESSDTSPLSLDLSLTFTNDYYFRGIVQRRDSLNVQPSIELTFNAATYEAVSLSVLGGVWSDFCGERASGARDAFSEYWYEQDAYAGVSIGVGRLSISGIYTWYASPASDFTEVEDVTLTCSFDDAGLWDDAGSFSVGPWASIAIETHNAASGPDSGVWLGLGVEPRVALGHTPLGDAALSFPITLGLSLDDYYQLSDGSTSTFGFVEAGGKFTFDLSEQFGPAAPTLDIGVSYLFLGGVLQDLNDGHSGEVMFSVGLGWSF